MDLYGSYSALKLARENAIFRITMDNPTGNAISADAHGELSRIFRAVAGDDRVRVVILTGAGTFGFSVGGDIAGMETMLDDPSRWGASMIEAREIVLGLLDCDKPVIARINGHAIGLGATLALCCDVTIMCESAKIGDPHVKVGLAAGDGGALLWPHLIGLVRARRYLMTGDLLTGRQAQEIGLITEAVPLDALDDVVAGWAERFSEAPATALKLTKRALNGPLRQQAQAFMDAHLGMETLSYLNADHREAVMAQVEKRPPSFRR